MPDDKLIQGVRFKRLIMDSSATDRSFNPPPEPGFKRLVLCSGKVYYDLFQVRSPACCVTWKMDGRLFFFKLQLEFSLYSSCSLIDSLVKRLSFLLCPRARARALVHDHPFILITSSRSLPLPSLPRGPQEREKQGKQGEIAICRVEQLAPFPFDLISRELKR